MEIIYWLKINVLYTNLGKADLAAESAVLLPPMLTCPGTQQEIMSLLANDKKTFPYHHPIQERKKKLKFVLFNDATGTH